LAEEHLRFHDPVLGRVIDAQKARWNDQQTEDVIWGLIRIVISQQISTRAASTIGYRVERAFPLAKTGQVQDFSYQALRSCGLSPRKASCCLAIVGACGRLRAELTALPPRWERLFLIPGIGDWTVDLYRIMVLKQTDILPRGDIGLRRAVLQNYPCSTDLGQLATLWSPYRSIACWYLWRSLGNPPLG
jgi:DNA-3-methyladenine glycosylase II